MVKASPICLRLLRQATRLPFSFALEMAGNNMEARMVMMAITTSNSIKVNAVVPFRLANRLMIDSGLVLAARQNPVDRPLKFTREPESGHADSGNLSLVKLVMTFPTVKGLSD